MFGDRVRKVHYLDKNGKRTTDIFEARMMINGKRFPILFQQYKQPHLFNEEREYRTIDGKVQFVFKDEKPDITYLPGEHKSIFWWTSTTEMRNDLREKGCFPGVCKYESCWLEFYPEHRCKYRLTLPQK